MIDSKHAADLTDNNTIGNCAALGTTYTGECEDVRAMDDLLVERNLNVPIHIDAAIGDFVAPFNTPQLEWDFRLEKVASINVSGHEYGHVRYESLRRIPLSLSLSLFESLCLSMR